MEKYDVCIIGAGPSGYAAAMRAVDFKKKVLLVEKDRVGGAGVTNGALSSKTLWEMSREVSTLNEHLPKLGLPNYEISFKDVRKQVQSAIQMRKDLLVEHLKSINSGLLIYKNGTAKLLTKNEVEIVSSTGKEVVHADNIILATGSRPRYLPEIPIDEKIIMTSNGIEKMDHFPKSMVILGAGVIGCEFATIFSGFHKTKVHLIDKGDHILPFEDSDIVSVIEKRMEENGVLIHRNSKMVKMTVVDGMVVYELAYDDGTKEVFEVEKALVSVGRIPNYENMGLEEIGIEMDGRGVIDHDTRTSIPNIYAVGDITADIALVNVGELEGRQAVEKMFGSPKRELIYENISTIMFLSPEVAGVGLNEKQAQAKGMDYKVASVDYSCIARAVAQRNTTGFIKLLVTDDDDMKLLGMRVVGNHASSAIQAVALLISMDKGIEELAECVHPHPSITEGIQECVRLLLGKSLFKPEALGSMLKCRRCCEGNYEDIHF